MEPEIADDMLSQRPVIKEKSKYILAKSYFDVKEYSRWLSNMNHPKHFKNKQKIMSYASFIFSGVHTTQLDAPIL